MNEQELREQIAEELERQAFIFMKSNEYTFHDTALRSKTLLLAAEIVRGTFNG
jgi:hypothetical protein